MVLYRSGGEILCCNMMDLSSMDPGCHVVGRKSLRAVGWAAAGEEKLVFSRFWRSRIPSGTSVRRRFRLEFGDPSVESARCTRVGLRRGAGPRRGRLLPADASAGARPQGHHQPMPHETDPAASSAAGRATESATDAAGIQGTSAPT